MMHRSSRESGLNRQAGFASLCGIGRMGVVLVLAVTMAVCAHAISVNVRTTGGPVRGVREGGVVAFRGIPFAAPPIGELRWRPPQPHAPWTIPRPAGEWGSQVSEQAQRCWCLCVCVFVCVCVCVLSYSLQLRI